MDIKLYHKPLIVCAGMNPDLHSKKLETEPELWHGHQKSLLDTTNLINLYAIPWLRQLVASLSPQRPRFKPWSVHVGFVWTKRQWDRFLSQLFFFTLSILFHGLHTHTPSR
jgi:hypothetical protein